MLLFLALPAFAEDAPRPLDVVVSSRPLHSLVAGVMERSGASPRLLVAGKTPPLRFVMNPPHYAAVAEADLVIYAGDRIEPFMSAAVAKLPEKKKLALDPAVPLYEPGLLDPHPLLSPANAAAAVQAIAIALAKADPAQYELYLANAREMRVHLQRLDWKLSQDLSDAAGMGYISYHDAFGAFEKRYGLKPALFLVSRPGDAPLPETLDEAKQQITSGAVHCIFHEPQYESLDLDKLLEQSRAKSGLLDSEGTAITPGVDLYERLLMDLTQQYRLCLE